MNKKVILVSSNNKKPQAGIGAFFSRSANKPINKLVSNLTKNNSEQNLENEQPNLKVSQELLPSKESSPPLNTHDGNNTNKEILDTSKTSLEKPKKLQNKKVKAVPQKVNSKQSKKKPTKQIEKDAKKRKRLVVLSDSESNNSSEEEEVVREPTPEPESTPAPELEDNDIVLGTPEPTSKRKRKLVSKTFTSDEGYMVTEKHYVNGSCSEDDEGAPGKKFKESKLNAEINVKEKPKEEKIAPIPATISPQKKKQASLMSFFKKK